VTTKGDSLNADQRRPKKNIKEDEEEIVKVDFIKLK